LRQEEINILFDKARNKITEQNILIIYTNIMNMMKIQLVGKTDKFVMKGKEKLKWLLNYII
jgi:hypothetical protein